MDPSIQERIRKAWSPVGRQFLAVLDDAISDLDNLLKLEEHRQHGHEQVHVRKALGPFARGTINLESFAGVLGERKETRALTDDRERRIRRLLAALRSARAAYEVDPPGPVFCALTQDETAVLEAAAGHLAALAALFGNLHAAQLETRSRYQPEIHDATFRDFQWHQLSPAEIQLCPPFVVQAELDQDDRAAVQKMMAVLNSRMPVTVLALRRAFRKRYAPGLSPRNPAASTLEMLPLFMRGVFAVQACIANPNLEELLRRGITSSRPAMISLFWDDQAGEAGLLARSKLALLSRAFPTFVYNPDRAASFASCLDITGNPCLENTWGDPPRTGAESGDPPAAAPGEYTFADFAFNEHDHGGEFSEVPAGTPEGSLVPLNEFLGLNRAQRIGRIPFIIASRGESPPGPWIPSLDVITQTFDRLHLWRTLQEFSGINNPFVKTAMSTVREKVDAERQLALDHLRMEMEAQAQAREQAAVAGAIRNLTARLIGLDPESILLAPLVALTGKPLPPAADVLAAAPPGPVEEKPGAAAVPPAAPADGSPWIETARCTSCDECMTINGSIFAYNGDKKAVIKDPRGGPFKDLVRAAEKCTAEIIHPGKPWDPGEKDLEKWIKRAARFL